jgi:hypothetical protein
MSWEAIGREYMAKAKRAEPWKGILYGVVHTNLLDVDQDTRAVKRILRVAPTPEEARRACPLDPGLLADLPFYNPKTAVDAVCDKAVNADRVIPLFRACARQQLQQMKREQLKTGEKGLDLVGLKWKGIDMTLLDSGCEVPVIDRHLAYYLNRQDPAFSRELGEPKTDTEVEKKLYRIQSSTNPEKYERLWRIARGWAERSGLPAGVWHVSVWMRERFTRRYPNLPEEARLEMARRYVRRLFR